MDTHVHLAAAMNKKQLLRFIKGKVETESDLEVVKSRDGVVKTLGQVLRVWAVPVSVAGV